MPVIRLCWIVLLMALVALAAGCANTSESDFSAAIEPDMSVLAPAKQALAQANSGQVERFAPRALDSARQNISLAEDIITLAARQGRALNDSERARVQDLAQSAQLDAQLAIVQTRAKTAAAKLKQLQGILHAGDRVAATPGGAQ